MIKCFFSNKLTMSRYLVLCLEKQNKKINSWYSTKGLSSNFYASWMGYRQTLGVSLIHASLVCTCVG